MVIPVVGLTVALIAGVAFEDCAPVYLPVQVLGTVAYVWLQYLKRWS
jgi:hypothetical protein